MLFWRVETFAKLFVPCSNVCDCGAVGGTTLDSGTCFGAEAAAGGATGSGSGFLSLVVVFGGDGAFSVFDGACLGSSARFGVAGLGFGDAVSCTTAGAFAAGFGGVAATVGGVLVAVFGFR